MSKLVPNAPISRMEHVIKLYWKKWPRQVINTASIAAFMVGHDENASAALVWLDHAYGHHTRRDLDLEARHARAATDAMRTNGRAQQMFERLTPLLSAPNVSFAFHGTATTVRPSYVDWSLYSLCVFLGTAMPEHFDRDFLFPWVARELVALAKMLGSPDPEDDAYSDAVQALMEKGNAIAIWSKETRTDISKVNLVQALETIETHVFKTKLVDQGEVVFEFGDGWTMQELRTKELLAEEGDAMQHCVGGYAREVEYGNSRIYSLRDPSGNPHATLEWEFQATIPPGLPETKLRYMEPLDFIRQRHGLVSGWFNQILGKQNAPITEKYRQYVVRFIHEAFGGEPMGLLLAGVPGSEIRFQDRYLRGANFNTENRGWPAKLDSSDFDECDLFGASFSYCDLPNASFVAAKLHGVNFEHADLRGVDFDQADLTGAYFTRATLYGASMLDVETNADTNLASAKDLESVEGIERIVIALLNDTRDIGRRRRGGGWSSSFLDRIDVVYDDFSDEWMTRAEQEAIHNQGADLEDETDPEDDEDE